VGLWSLTKSSRQLAATLRLLDIVADGNEHACLCAPHTLVKRNCYCYCVHTLLRTPVRTHLKTVTHTSLLSELALRQRHQRACRSLQGLIQAQYMRPVAVISLPDHEAGALLWPPLSSEDTGLSAVLPITKIPCTVGRDETRAINSARPPDNDTCARPGLGLWDGQNQPACIQSQLLDHSDADDVSGVGPRPGTVNAGCKHLHRYCVT
jgi:hypothetical protein